jgi:hypothetical protein
LEVSTVQLPELVPGLPEPIKIWVVEFRRLSLASGVPKQAELAQLLSVKQSSINRYLSGERVLDPSAVGLFVDLARARGVSIDESHVRQLHEAAVKAKAKTRRPRRRAGAQPLPPEAGEPSDGTLGVADKSDRQDDVAEPGGLGRFRRLGLSVGVGSAALVVGLGMAVLLGVFSLGEPQQNQARVKVGCWGPTCKGKNHNEQGCIDGRKLVTSQPRDGVVVQVLYSTACRAAWGKIVGTNRGAVVQFLDGNGESETIVVSGNGRDKQAHPTLMLPGLQGTRLHTCVTTTGTRTPLCTEEVTVA